MFGVPIDGPTNIFCDNRGVVRNASIPESTLMKKHNAINYHAVREAAAAGILRVGKEDGETNAADLLTNRSVDRSVGTSAGISCGNQPRRSKTSETTLNYERETSRAKVAGPPESTVGRWPIIGFTIYFYIYLSAWRGCSFAFASWVSKPLAIPISRGPNEP
jgi:hypothetical protein